MASGGKIFIVTVSMLAGLSPASFVWAADTGQAPGPGSGGEMQRIPGLPPIQMPRSGINPDHDDFGRPGFDRQFGAAVESDPRDDRRRGDGLGATVIGPGGVIPPQAPTAGPRAAPPAKKVLTPAEKADAIRKALAPKPPLASARRHTLDDLYAKLAAAKDEDEAKGLAGLIGAVWMRTSSDTAILLMNRAVQSIEHKDYPLALQLLDQIVQIQPHWAEAWNKRASVRYFAGDIDGSMADVEHVLKLEPKHFGALEGMATILQRTHLDKRALEIYRRALAIYPHQPEVQKIVDKLTLEVEGQGI